MKRILSAAAAFCLMAGMTACGRPAGPSAASETPISSPSEGPTGEAASGNHILVAYFSLANEQYEVGVIEKGNTQIVAEIIAEATGADTFQIESTEEYPTTYDGLLEVSRQEENDPPQIAGTVEDMDGYDTIFLG